MPVSTEQLQMKKLELHTQHVNRNIHSIVLKNYSLGSGHDFGNYSGWFYNSQKM